MDSAASCPMIKRPSKVTALVVPVTVISAAAPRLTSPVKTTPVPAAGVSSSSFSRRIRLASRARVVVLAKVSAVIVPRAVRDPDTSTVSRNVTEVPGAVEKSRTSWPRETLIALSTKSWSARVSCKP